MIPEAAYPAPSSDPWNQAFITGGWSSTRSAGGDCEVPPCNQTLTGTLTYNSFPAFGDMTGAVAYFAGGWVALSATVTGGNLSGTNKRIDVSFPKSDDKVYPGGGNNNRFRLVGKKAFLTGNNQWYYDAAARQLFMRAPNGGVPTNVYAKMRNYAFDLRGRSRYTKVVNRGSGLLLDISAKSVADGAAAIQYRDTGGTNQHWQVVVDGSYRTLVNRNSGKVLDVTGGSVADGTAVIQWTGNGGANQQWSLVPAG